ncbi:peptide chain release factor N(5)-glutamine methyltransferase [Gemmatimonas sp.]
MTLREVVNRVVELLGKCDALEPEVRRDAAREGRLLVAGVLQLSPGGLAQRLVVEPALKAGEADAIEQALHRRLRGEPLAYALGHAAFRDLVLHVDARVLIPRPETEVVVEEALRVAAGSPGGVAVDIGTGSGAIALALATEGHFDRVIATDISTDALAVASANAEAMGLRGSATAAHQRSATAATATGTPVEFRHGADLAPLQDVSARVIVSNPPYIAYEEAIALPPSVRNWEPPVALFAPNNGLARYAELVHGARRVLEPGGWLVLELDANRAAPVVTMAEAAGYDAVQVKQDLAGRDRVLLARAPAR